MAVVGTDGCRAGWFAVRIESSGDHETRVFGDFGSLWRSWGDASLILVDIPIGLPDAGKKQRECDSLARRLLGPRRSSVFTPPSRVALEHATHEQASEANFREVDRKLSIQSWHLVPKIREVDRLLREDQTARKRVREVHPEVCFWAFAGSQPMKSNKKRSAGRRERLDVLCEVHRGAKATHGEAIGKFKRREVAQDDILDALAAAYTAERCLGRLRSFPETPEHDSLGLPMEMVYCPADRLLS